jgi:nicotinate-nucleotide adenylyltransferase
MRVAIFGGSFNPPHIGHQLAALYVLETHAVDALWFVPTFEHPFDKPLIPFSERAEMCRLAAAALGARASVSDIEARLGGPSHTLRTVERLRLDRPGARFSLVIGADLVPEVDGWHGSGELRKAVDFIVVNRSGHGADQSILPAMPAVSSTAIRDALENGRDVSRWVARSVLDYIGSRGLYGAAAPPNQS